MGDGAVEFGFCGEFPAFGVVEAAELFDEFEIGDLAFLEASGADADRFLVEAARVASGFLTLAVGFDAAEDGVDIDADGEFGLFDAEEGLFFLSEGLIALGACLDIAEREAEAEADGP